MQAPLNHVKQRVNQINEYFQQERTFKSGALIALGGGLVLGLAAGASLPTYPLILFITSTYYVSLSVFKRLNNLCNRYNNTGFSYKTRFIVNMLAGALALTSLRRLDVVGWTGLVILASLNAYQLLKIFPSQDKNEINKKFTDAFYLKPVRQNPKHIDFFEQELSRFLAYNKINLPKEKREIFFEFIRNLPIDIFLPHKLCDWVILVAKGHQTTSVDELKSKNARFLEKYHLSVVPPKVNKDNWVTLNKSYDITVKDLYRESTLRIVALMNFKKEDERSFTKEEVTEMCTFQEKYRDVLTIGRFKSLGYVHGTRRDEWQVEEPRRRLPGTIPSQVEREAAWASIGEEFKKKENDAINSICANGNKKYTAEGKTERYVYNEEALYNLLQLNKEYLNALKEENFNYPYPEGIAAFKDFKYFLNAAHQSDDTIAECTRRFIIFIGKTALKDPTIINLTFATLMFNDPAEYRETLQSKNLHLTDDLEKLLQLQIEFPTQTDDGISYQGNDAIFRELLDLFNGDLEETQQFIRARGIEELKDCFIYNNRLWKREAIPQPPGN